MPKLACDCGYVINLSIVPSPYGFAVIGERDFEELRERLETAESQQAVWLYAVGPNGIIRQAYICPRCGRLHLFASAGATTRRWRSGRLSAATFRRPVPPEAADEP